MRNAGYHGLMAVPIDDLGHGVRVDVASDEGPVVHSEDMALPWRPRAGQFVGTAVAWCDQLYEAVSVERNEGVEKWQLAPWPEGEAARNIDRLDVDRMTSLCAEAIDLKNSRTMRRVLVLFAPLTGLMPVVVQRHWETTCNFPAARATIISALVEMGIGGWWALNLGPVLLGFFGWLLFAEGMVRLGYALSRDVPLGSFVAKPFDRVFRRPITVPETTNRRFEVIRWDLGDQEMSLEMGDLRTDWNIDGILRFRGSLWRLVEIVPGGGRVVCHFEGVPDGSPVTLSLVPPEPKEIHRERGRGWVHDMTRFVLLSFAARRFQEQLVPDLGLGIRTLTWISAGVELFGGTVNLLGSGPRDTLVGLDLLFVIEGAYRLVNTAVTGLPVGSVLGLPFVNVYERWVKSGTGSRSTLN